MSGPGRRQVLAGAGVLALLGVSGRAMAEASGGHYGLIGKIRAQLGQRAALIAALSGGIGTMPGNLLYLVAEDAGDADLIWVTEMWDSVASHRASLQLPAVQEAIRIGRPLIAGFDTVATLGAATGLPV